MKKTFTFLSAIFLFHFSFGQFNLDSGLVASYHFTGNTLDSSGNGNDATPFGPALTVGKAGIPNTAYYFNGTSDYMFVPNSMSLDTNTVISMCCVVKPMGFWSGPCMGNVIFWKGDDRYPGHYGLIYGSTPYTSNCNIADTIDETVFPEVGTIYDYDTPPYTPNMTSNTWYCVVATYDGDSMRLYVDGVYKYTTRVDAFGTTDSAMYIGHSPFLPQFPYWLNGVIDDIGIYNRVLGTEEVKYYCDYVSGYFTSTGSLVNTEQDFDVYPNPSKGEINISLRKSSYGGEIVITDVMGKKIYSEKVNATHAIQLNTASGVYFVQLKNEGAIITKKVIIE
jgi:hypothetical protein